VAAFADKNLEIFFDAEPAVGDYQITPPRNNRSPRGKSGHSPHYFASLRLTTLPLQEPIKLAGHSF
jgi:hypothetical protein